MRVVEGWCLEKGGVVDGWFGWDGGWEWVGIKGC